MRLDSGGDRIGRLESGEMGEALTPTHSKYMSPYSIYPPMTSIWDLTDLNLVHAGFTAKVLYLHFVPSAIVASSSALTMVDDCKCTESSSNGLVPLVVDH